MSRPSRIEMVAQFFPELREGSTKADREAAIQYNLLACEVVMADLLQKYDREFEKYGPGVLCMRLNKGARKSEYLTEKEVQTDYDLDALDNSLDDLIGELIEISSFEKDVIDREDLATMLIAAYGELSKFNDSLLEDDRYDELRGMGKLCELMIDSLIKRFDEFMPTDYV